MTIHSPGIVFSLALVCSILGWQEIQATASPQKPAFIFREVSFFHRWSKNNQHEFTPEKQEDLDKWADMITINAYPDIHDGEHLAERANAVLENYKTHQAKVLKTRSVPRTAERAAEHVIVVMFNRPHFVEVAFARFKLVDGKGFSFVYSHRLYGEGIGDQTDAWLGSKGPDTEKALMEWNSMPPLDKLGSLSAGMAL